MTLGTDRMSLILDNCLSTQIADYTSVPLLYNKKWGVVVKAFYKLRFSWQTKAGSFSLSTESRSLDHKILGEGDSGKYHMWENYTKSALWDKIKWCKENVKTFSQQHLHCQVSVVQPVERGLYNHDVICDSLTCWPIDLLSSSTSSSDLT